MFAGKHFCTSKIAALSTSQLLRLVTTGCFTMSSVPAMRSLSAAAGRSVGLSGVLSRYGSSLQMAASVRAMSTLNRTSTFKPQFAHNPFAAGAGRLLQPSRSVRCALS